MEKDLESCVRSIVIDTEYDISKSNNDQVSRELDSYIDLMECKRTEKDYDWMSDNFLPEFPSIILTDASDWANQYFVTRSFVEAKLEGDQPDDVKKCEAAKRVINKTLNNKAIYHFQKYIRARTINALVGIVYLVCWWEQEKRDKFLGYKDVPSQDNIDIFGNPMVAPNIQMPKMEKVEQYESEITRDMFNYDVIDPRNVFTDNRYAYSAQDKEFIIIRSEQTLDDLKRKEKTHGYINLDKLGKVSTPQQTDTEREIRPDDNPEISVVNPKFDVLERFGKFWCNILEHDGNGYPSKVAPGYDEFGNVLDKAQLIECIITFVQSASTYTMIRFQPTPFVDSTGKPYRPIIRGICYIHPTKDTGLSDGLLGKELQIAINDTFNMSNDRIKLATLPTLKIKKYQNVDNPTIYFEPQHAMEVEDPNDVQEFKISDDVTGALNQIAMLKNSLQQATAKFPTSMGDVPRTASTTATAVSEAGGKSGLRTNYKSLTVEYTMLTDFYWMILQLADQFADPGTMEKMLGDRVYDFDPNADYSYSPVTSAIETEYGKMRKLTIIDQFIGRVANIPNPGTPRLLNYLLKKAFSLFDDEFPEYETYLLDESVPPPVEGGMPSMASPNVQPTSNQNGVPMGDQEMMTRGM